LQSVLLCHLKGATLSPGSRNSEKSAKTARAEAARQVLEADKRRRRNVMLAQVAVVVVVVAAVMGGTVIALQGSDDAAVAAGTPPASVTDDGSVVVGNPEAPVTVQVIEDFQCPACQSFEAGFGEQLDSYTSGDDVNVEYRGIAFLDRASTTDYSSRALNASACVIDTAGTDVWKEFHRQMFLQQPPEGGAGLPDSDLVAIAEDAGADDVETCVDDRAFADWVTSTTVTATGEPDFAGTPTVLVNGEKVDTTSEAITEAVDQALTS